MTTPRFIHYEMQLTGDGSLRLQQRVEKDKSSETLLEPTPAEIETQLWYNTDPDYSDDVDPHSVKLEIVFGDTGMHPKCYHGNVVARLDWDQLVKLRDFANFLLTLRPPV